MPSLISDEGSKNHVEPVPQASACALASTIENDSHTTEEPSKVKGGYGRKEMVNNSVTKSAEKTKKENADKLKALPEETSMKKSASKRHASFDQEHQGKMADGAEGSPSLHLHVHSKEKKLKVICCLPSLCFMFCESVCHLVAGKKKKKLKCSDRNGQFSFLWFIHNLSMTHN